ncbi:hypothetical protein BDV28DRAFT_133924 [Aspergillus coremiiformis]|uniref:Aminoglycoside phosphotransferase domain-containing protein n=1 Tax=Aspergillus coremiiformis TaxID=138285 RepID=A0A5N6Z799_9EURO|nr:hypothetical protein BDV28DRAFT_133924 [Aspergillus coremiiformis]
MASIPPNQQLEGENVMEYTSSDSSGHDEYALFSAVMESIRLDRLSKYATTTRKSIPHHNRRAFHVVNIGTPIFGSYHVLYPVKFDDGAAWLLKVPANGTREKFRDTDARALRSEALTMRLLRRETTIPLPDVFAFSDTCDNELNCPFILINHVEGNSLYKVWFNNASPTDVVQARRVRCLQDIAGAMVQLDKFSFNQGGSLHFDDRGFPLGIGSFRLVDNAAILERSKDGDHDESTIFLEAGPFSNTKEYYTALLDHRKETKSTVQKGTIELLRLFIDWIPEPGDKQEAFVLAHPDFDIQNFLVSEDGALQAIIDWDGVSAVPRSVGNERYPRWLTRDWNPATYGWTENMGRRAEPVGIWEDSPDNLRFYRSVYARSIRCHQLQGGPPCANPTTRSLIHENLLLAANDPPCTLDIIEEVFNTIVKIVQKGVLPVLNVSGDTGDSLKGEIKIEDDELEGLDFYSISCALIEKRLREHHRRLLIFGFKNLLSQSSTL